MTKFHVTVVEISVPTNYDPEIVDIDEFDHFYNVIINKKLST